MPSTKEPVKNTCPIIDNTISTIKSIIGQMSKCDEDMSTKAILKNISDWYNDLESIGVGKNCILEDLRDANSNLRSWGNEWMEEACKFEQEVLEIKNILEGNE